MPKLIACIIAYNEQELLPQCLESIVGKVDEIIVVEGRIATFPGKQVRSSDQTIKIAESYGATIITSLEAWPDEPTMRSQYLIGSEGDWYIHIDADEKCMTPLPGVDDFPDGIDAYAINIRMIKAPTQIYRPRFFRHCGHMEYRAIHDALFSDDALISRPQDVPQLRSVWFAHYQMVRSEKRRKQKTQYYRRGYKHEPEYRQKWSMFNHG